MPKGRFIATQRNSTRRRVELSYVGEVSIVTRRRNSARRRVELRRYKRAFRIELPVSQRTM